MIRAGARMFGFLLLIPVPMAAQASVSDSRIFWVTETGLTVRATGDRYPDERVYFSYEFGALWQYDEFAGVGALVRGGLRVERNIVHCHSLCALPDAFPWALELRFRRKLEGPFTLGLGSGVVLDYSKGFTSHIALEAKEAFVLSAHGDRYEGDWHLLLGANLAERPGLVALGASLVFRVLGSFGDTVDNAHALSGGRIASPRHAGRDKLR